MVQLTQAWSSTYLANPLSELRGTGPSSAMADLPSRRAAASASSRLKPIIYKTDDGKVIVEDELLNFLVVKMRTLSHDEIVLLVTSTFTSERIDTAVTLKLYRGRKLYRPTSSFVYILTTCPATDDAMQKTIVMLL